MTLTSSDPFAVTLYAPAQLIVSTRIEFGKRVSEALEAGHDVIVDVTSCGYIDSAALGMLLRVSRQGREGGRHVCLRGCTPELCEFLERAQLLGALLVCQEAE